MDPAQLGALLDALHARGYRLLEATDAGIKVLPVSAGVQESDSSAEELSPGQKQEADLEMLFRSSGSPMRPRPRVPAKADS